MAINYGNAEAVIIYATDADHKSVLWREKYTYDDNQLVEGHIAKVPRYPEASNRHLNNAHYNNMTLMALKNTESPGGATFTVSWSDNVGNANTQDIPPGGLLVLPDVDGDVQISAGIGSAALNPAAIKTAMWSRE